MANRLYKDVLHQALNNGESFFVVRYALNDCIINRLVLVVFVYNACIKKILISSYDICPPQRDDGAISGTGSETFWAINAARLRQSQIPQCGPRV